MNHKLITLLLLSFTLQTQAQELTPLKENTPLMTAKVAEVRLNAPTQNLQFDNGQTHIKGHIKAHNIAIYTFEAPAGAKLEIKNKNANNMEIAVFNPRTGMRLEAPITLPENGNYELRIVNNRANLEKNPKSYPYELSLELKQP